MGRSEVSTSVVKWCEGLSNRVPIIIRKYRSYEVCCLYGSFAYHIFFMFFSFHFLSLYIWLYVLYASI